jgi:hypothetical protein
MPEVPTAEPDVSPAVGWQTHDADGWPVLPPTLLTIHRASPRDEQSRQVVCSLDGQHVTDLLYGQSCTVEILPGEHTLHVHNTLMWRTARFEAVPGGHVHFCVVNHAPPGFHILLLIIGVAPLLLTLERGVPAG